MVLKIRLRQQGRSNAQTYRLVVVDIRKPRDGKYLEKLGWYDPSKPSGEDSVVDAERIQHWVGQGAQLSLRAQSLLARAVPNLMKEIRAKEHSRRVTRAAKRRALKKAP